MQNLSFTAMNTTVLLAAEAPTNLGPLFDGTMALIHSLERRFSRFLPESELSALNRRPGQWQEVSSDLFTVVSLALDFADETDGLFDPTVLPALRRIGYDRSMTLIRREGAMAPHPEHATKSGFRDIELDQANLRIRLPRSVQVDLGGIAKGWIVERAAAQLHEQSAACAVSAGGDIVFMGYPTETPGWQVAIEDPQDPARSVAYLQVGPGAIATSSVTKRAWRQGEVLRHHIIDPRTSESAKVDALSVTVVAPSMAVAEVYAKALLICGEATRPQVASKRADISYFVAWPDGIVTPNGMEIHSGLALSLA